MKEDVVNFWQDIYRTHPNRMEEMWTEERRRIYEEELEIRRRQQREEERRERGLILPRVVLDPYRNIRVMDVHINKEEIRKTLKRLKNGKAGGVDGLKPEMYKVLEGSEVFVEALRSSCQRVVETGEVPESWKRSRTVMVPKTTKPTAGELRPIAMTDISYKILMAVLRDRIEEQIERNGMRKDEQIGFTPGGMIADNLFLLQECVQEVCRRREEMVVVAVDFKKAYDSIKRETILEVLKEYRVEGRVVEVFKKVYSEDKTRITIGEETEVEVEVESGIRQGCTASTILFKLITFKIIEALRRKLEGVRVGDVRLRCLFFADDGLILARSVREAEEGIRELKRVAGKYGLEMNNMKSKVLMYNAEAEVETIEGIAVVDEVRYLGVTVQSKRNLFEKHRRDMVEKAKRMSGLTYSVIEKGCHKVMIGKCFWKGVVLPRVLYGAEVVRLRVEDVNTIQRQENAAMRRMLGAPRYVAVAGMRGVIGISTVKSRVARSRLQYFRRVEQSENEMLRKIMRREQDRGTEWMRETRKSMNWAAVDEEELKVMTKEEVKRKVAEKVQEEWREEMEQKSSLRIYRMFKTEMKEVDHEGGMASRLWFAARTGCMRLACRRWGEESERCDLCGGEREDEEHFILECEALEDLIPKYVP